MTQADAIEILKNTSPLRITISGDIGGGKSTFAKRLAEELNVPRIYMGQLFREEAERRGITLDELGQLQLKDASIDRQLDEVQRQKSLEIERGIFEGRTSWYFVQNPTVRLFIGVDPNIAAERIWGDNNNPLRDQYKSLEEVKARNQERKMTEVRRYQKYHGIDAYDPKNFDIVLETSDRTIEETFHDSVIALAEFIKKGKS